MKTGPNGYALIRHFEGLRTEAYPDITGKLTIGYGHVDGVTPDMHISPATAEIFLEADVKAKEDRINADVHVPLSQNQFDALVSFEFNLGEGNLEMLLNASGLNEKNYADVPKHMVLYDKARDPKTGEMVDVPGLEARRRAEAVLFADNKLIV